MGVAKYSHYNTDIQWVINQSIILAHLGRYDFSNISTQTLVPTLIFSLPHKIISMGVYRLSVKV